ncbi:hypothetical protein O9A_00241 [Bartonella koehlerae C-29]|uniref:Uncharacterized protein n=1 Tax=Bartonella koehlerae C-29 TaxID=1134510 RepID=A0A067WAW0_9HYPH|nr:hypothetical protein O9A_00241 [Bartonella koehlerae C-29]
MIFLLKQRLWILQYIPVLFTFSTYSKGDWYAGDESSGDKLFECKSSKTLSAIIMALIFGFISMRMEELRGYCVVRFMGGSEVGLGTCKGISLRKYESLLNRGCDITHGLCLLKERDRLQCERIYNFCALERNYF